MSRPQYSLAELAARFDLELVGDGSHRVIGICSLEAGAPDRIGFLSSPKHAHWLTQTAAGAVIVAASARERLGAGNALIAAEPQLAFARVAELFDLRRQFTPGIDASASLHPDAQIGSGVFIGAQVVVEQGACIGDGVYLGHGCVIGTGARVGAGSRLEARVVLGPDCVIGAQCSIEPGAVIGARGFGNVVTRQGWVAMPQLGRVLVGDRVEVGANSTIDRGAIDDTVIEDNVRIDNLVQIAHNCRIGAGTAIAACTGIAGSTRVGRRCMIGGAAAIAGHITIADDVIILGRTMVTHSLGTKGIYGSGLPVDEAGEWRKTVARVRRLDRLEARLKYVERQLKLTPESTENNG